MFYLFAAKFSEHSEGRLGVQEADVEAFSARTALLVDQAHALLLGLVEGLVGVLHRKGDVVHAALAAVLLDEGSNGALGAGGLQKFDFHVAAAEKGSLDLLVGHFLDGLAFQPHHVFPIADGLVEVRHGDADVFNV